MQAEQTRIPERQQRLLAEWICREEEAEGHPRAAPEAEHRAIQSGGSFGQRVLNRAVYLDADGSRLSLVRKTLGLGRLMGLGLAALAALAGAIAAGTALGRDEVISVPMVLLALVGVNLLSLLAWVLFQIQGAGDGGLIAGIWRRSTRRFLKSDARLQTGLLPILTTGHLARWRLSLVGHGAWLAYTLAGLICLAALLSVREYQLDWQTTLLSDQTLHASAKGLSYPHRVLGLPGPDVMRMERPMSESDRRGWALWLLVAVASYGLIPRLLVAGLCLWKVRIAESRWASDESRPGIARLRSRLMPRRSTARVVDAAAGPELPEPAGEPSFTAPPADEFRVVAVDCLYDNEAGASKIRKVEDSASRRQAEDWLREDAPIALVIIVSAITTPDRGIERTCRQLAEAAGLESWLALTDVDRLLARGNTLYQQRIADWRALAMRAGVEGGVGQWRDSAGTIEALGPGACNV